MGLGVMEMPKAPADITPEKFFTEWGPSQLDAFKDMISSLGGDVSTTVSFRVTGDGGGDWSITLDGGEVKIESGLKDDALVTAVMEAGNFVQAVTGQLEDLIMTPPGTENLTPEQAVAKAKENLEVLKTIHGSVKGVIEDSEQPFSALVKFQGALQEEADVTVTMDRSIALSIASGESNPQAAFMSGQVQISGDLSILMQLTPILLG